MKLGNINMRSIKRKLSDLWRTLIYDKSGTRVSPTKVTICILVAVLSISIAYSALSQSLNITGLITKVREKADIRITGISAVDSSEDSESNGGVSNYAEYNKSSISVGAYLPNYNSSVTYQVEVTNIGNVAMGLLEITGLPDVLSYELTDYTLKEKICDSTDTSKCTLGAVKEFYITIKYNNGVDLATANGYETDYIYNLNLNFNFQKIHSVKYENIEGSENYPSEIIATETLTVDFGDNAPDSSSLSVAMGDALTSSYTYLNGILTVPDVSGDIVVSGIPTVLCTAVNSSKAGSVKRGTEYKCQVNSITSYNFYVLSNDGDNVSLMMTTNLAWNVYFHNPNNDTDPDSYEIWDSLDKSNTPTILSELDNLTNDWVYVKDNSVEYTDKNGNYTVTLNGNVRLPKYDEIEPLCPCVGSNNSINGYSTSDYRYGCQTFVFGNYWTMDFNDDYEGYFYSSAAWAVGGSGFVALDDFNILDHTFGMRPVITIPKTRLEGYTLANDDSSTDSNPTCNTSGGGSSGGGSSGGSGSEEETPGSDYDTSSGSCSWYVEGARDVAHGSATAWVYWTWKDNYDEYSGSEEISFSYTEGSTNTCKTINICGENYDSGGNYYTATVCSCNSSEGTCN